MTHPQSLPAADRVPLLPLLLGRVRRESALRLAGIGLVLALGALHFLYLVLDDLARNRRHLLSMRVLEEGTGTITAAVLVIGIVLLERRWPVTRQTWRRALPVHAIGLLIFSALHTTLNLVTRDILSPLAGLGDYDYGRMSIRYFMELPMDVVVYGIVLTVLSAVRIAQQLRERELRSSELERALAQEQLRNLQLQLQPHFLFNALNTISERMYEDAAAADVMLSQLAELLRHALRAPLAHEVSLADEVALLENYVAIMRARFGDALEVRVDVDAAAADAAVPSLVLQPLVENAVRHGITPRGRGHVDVRVRRAGDWVEMAVADDGVGLGSAGATMSGGVGLSATRDRLQLFYGDAHAFEAGNRAEGGFAVVMRIPYRCARQLGDTDNARLSGVPTRATLPAATAAP